MSRLSPAALAATAAFAAAHVLLHASPGAAQAPPTPPGPLEVVVTANRGPTSIQRTGSAITIVPEAEIAARNPASLVDALRSVPGLDITEAGGPGAVTTLRIRGANAGQTLVLVDGVRINDPSSASGEFDAAVIAPGLIERIEVLRGPQSALYGSDAIGGVVNIITRKGRGKPAASLTVEGGRYGTLNAVVSLAGSSGPWSYAFSGIAQGSSGFSRYGYRIGRLAGQNNIAGAPGGRFEDDGYNRFGGFGRIGYDAGDGFRFDVGVIRVDTEQFYDAAFGAFPDTPAFARRRFTQASAKAELDGLDGAITHSLQVFANRTDRLFRDVSLGRTGGVLRQTSRGLTGFNGDRVGAEYQATLRLRQFGSLILGARAERETADSFSTAILPTPGPKRRTLAAEQDTTAAFALWQLPIGERLSVSLGGRYDKVSDVDEAFPTWRATAAYRIPETGTKLRASAGTGAKAPTLFQRFSPQFGTQDLAAERSFGVDAGFDQDLFGGRATLSVTGFSNRIRDLIDFVSSPCPPPQTGCYVNVSRARTSGVEVAAKAVLVEERLSLTGAYTYLDARDRSTGLLLARRAPHLGRVALQFTPTSQWLIEPSVVFASERFSGARETSRLAPYARLDVRAEYRFNETWKAHARVENVTNARYEEVSTFGTTGRAAYAGLTASW